MLSQHYLANEDYSTTKRHLIAASIMLDRYQSEMQSKEIPEGIQDDREEMLNKCKSDLARSWGKYCLLLLQRSMDKDIADRSVTILFIRIRWVVKFLTIVFTL